MYGFRTLGSTAVLILGLTLSASAQGNNPLITVDEFGNGSLVFPGGGTSLTPGQMLADPGPGGLASALTYNLLGPPGLVAGDLLVNETVGISVILSDVVRFNPAGTGGQSFSSLVLYSDNGDGVDALADTGFPSTVYTNTTSLLEVGPEGDNGVFYTPTAGQPGFIGDGFSVTYHIISDSTPSPEPGSLALLGLGLAAMAAKLRKRNKPVA